ncbi:hypothetical protein D9M71_470970 [compost metagenome]
MTEKQFTQRALFNVANSPRLEDFSLVHRQANPQRYQPHQCGNDKRNAPTPVVQCRITADRCQAKTEHERNQGAGVDREPLPGTGERAPMCRGRLDQECRCGTELSARGKPLHQARKHQNDRRGDTDAVVVGAKTDHQRSQGHQQNGQRQALFSAVAVGDLAKHRAADGTHDEAHGKDCQYRQQAREAIASREELTGQD